MNTKNNQRSRSTIEKIVRAVFQKMTVDHKPLSKITVREICEEAGINRSTFYAYYMDVYDVVEQVEKTMSKDLTQQILAVLDRAESISDLFVRIFDFVKEYREFYVLYFEEINTSGAISLTWDLLSEQTSSLSYREIGLASQKEMEYLGLFFISGFTAVIRAWLKGGCRESSKDMVRIIVSQYTQMDRSLFEWKREDKEK